MIALVFQVLDLYPSKIEKFCNIMEFFTEYLNKLKPMNGRIYNGISEQLLMYKI